MPKAPQKPTHWRCSASYLVNPAWVRSLITSRSNSAIAPIKSMAGASPGTHPWYPQGVGTRGGEGPCGRSLGDCVAMLVTWIVPLPRYMPAPLSGSAAGTTITNAP